MSSRFLRRFTAPALVAAAVACGVPDYTFLPDAAPAPPVTANEAGPKDSGVAADTAPPVDSGDSGAPSPCRADEVAVTAAGATHCYAFTSDFVDCAGACGPDASVHLAIFETEEEDLKVTAAMEPFHPQLDGGTRYWIGLVPIDGNPTTARDGFRWSTGAKLDYFRWAPTEPEGATDDICVLQDPTNQSAPDAQPPLWYDHKVVGPAAKKLGLCEREPHADF